MPRYRKVARRSELPEGGLRGYEIEGEWVLVCNVGGRYHAVRDQCTHELYPLSSGELDGEVLTCTLHGACFDVRTGAVLGPPATRPVKTYEVRIDGDDLLIAVD